MSVLLHRVREHRHGGVKHSWPSPPGARAACHARLAWWNGAVAGCSEPRSGRAARACVCVECPAGLLHSLLAGCADLVGWRGACAAAAAARGVPPRAPRAVDCVVPGAARSGRAWCLKQCAGAWQRAWTVSVVHCGARRGVSGRAARSDGARGAWLVRAAGAAMGCQHRADAHDTGFLGAGRVFACARGRTRSFHAVCVGKGMRGVGRACIGV